MYNMICITNRHLCSNNFLEQIEKICRAYSSEDREAGIEQKPEFINEGAGQALQISGCSNKLSGQAEQTLGCSHEKSAGVGHAVECSNDGTGQRNEDVGQAGAEQKFQSINEKAGQATEICKCSEQNTGQAKPADFKIVLREKDLQEKEYEQLAKQVLDICSKYNIECILHTYYNTAEKLNCKKIHLPLNILRKNPEIAEKFEVIGVSAHSKEDAIEAENLGASYITAGHIFETDCKKGLPGRGLEFLRNVCESVDIPVYAIGGISSSNISEVIDAGAYGACMMSGFMKAETL